ncbi:MAG: hypothetical protein QM642_05340 [Edaphocola sp.]
MKKILLSVMALVLAWGCKKDKPTDTQNGNFPSTGHLLYVANEGAYGNGNASLTLINIDNDSVYQDIYRTANRKATGDVLQSVAVVGDEIFLAVNNSNKLLVIDKATAALKTSIDIPQPRYMAVGNEKIYISSLYHKEIFVINTQTKSVTDTIELDHNNTEGLTLYNGKLYACNWDTACNYVYEIDTANASIVRRIGIGGYAPQQAVADKNGNLWVMAGNVYQGETATLSCLNLANGTISKYFELPAGTDMMKPCMNPAADTIYYLGVNYDGGTQNNGVFRMDINATQPPDAPFIQAGALQYFWGLGIDPATGWIYVADPKGFVQLGSLDVYQTNGSLIKSYNTGVGPGFLLFRQ